MSGVMRAMQCDAKTRSDLLVVGIPPNPEQHQIVAENGVGPNQAWVGPQLLPQNPVFARTSPRRRGMVDAVRLRRE